MRTIFYSSDAASANPVVPSGLVGTGKPAGRAPDAVHTANAARLAGSAKRLDHGLMRLRS